MKTGKFWILLITIIICGTAAFFGFRKGSEDIPYNRHAATIIEYHNRGIWYLFGHILVDLKHANDCCVCNPTVENKKKYTPLLEAESYFVRNPNLSFTYIPCHTLIDQKGQKYLVTMYYGTWVAMFGRGFVCNYIPLTQLINNPIEK